MEFEYSCQSCHRFHLVAGTKVGKSIRCPCCSNEIQKFHPFVGPNFRYQLKKYLGKGGMGSVYLASDKKAGRKVAIKFCDSGSSAAERRFHREKLALVKIDHPNLCELYDHHAYNDFPFFTMEYLPGGTLSDRLRAGPWTIREAVIWTRTVANAVAFAHRETVVHRDLKPLNIMFDEFGELRVVDFGLALILDGDGSSRLTAFGVMRGTPDYMSPEQAMCLPKIQGKLCDVFILGRIFYELLTGKSPFGPDYPGIRGLSPKDRLIKGIFYAPSFFVPDLDPELEAICLKAMGNAPAARSTMQDFADGLADHADFRSPRGSHGKVYFGPPRNGLGLTPPSSGPAAAQVVINWYGCLRLEMANIPAGTFQMGSNLPGRPDEVARKVRIDDPYLIGRHPVTRGQYMRVIGGERNERILGHRHKHSRRPVYDVSWYDAILFCNRLSALDGLVPAYQFDAKSVLLESGNGYTLMEQTGRFEAARRRHLLGEYRWPIHASNFVDAWLECNRLSHLDGYPPAYAIEISRVQWDHTADGYRLPTEAEWERAGRVDGNAAYGEGDDETYLSRVAKYEFNSRGRTWNIGGRPENGFGVCDMLGNVWEWCWDYYQAGHQKERAEGESDTRGPSKGTERVLKGGSYRCPSTATRYAGKISQDPGIPWLGYGFGFRVARSLPTSR